MSDLIPNLTKIPAPRTPFLDQRTGLVSREWYKFFYNLFSLTGDGGNFVSLEDVQKGPPSIPNEIFNIDPNATTNAPSDSPLLSQIAEIEKTIEGIEVQPKSELGTMSQLQQANLPWVTFDTTPQSVPELTTGTLYWDNADRSKTLALVMEDTGAIVQDIGEETFYRVKATSNITKGQVLMFTGTVGASGGILAAPATGLTAVQSEYILGIATQDIATNAWGYATWFGELKGVNTTGGAETWVDGEILFYNPAVAGGLTKNIPTAPNPKVIVAAVVHAASNGILFVRPTFGSALGQTDSNVQITSLADGNILRYVSTNSRWENTPFVRIGTVASSASITINADAYDQYNITALAVDATINAPSGTPLNGQKLIIRILDDGTNRNLTWNAIFRVIGTTLPAATTATKTCYVGCIYNTAATKWDVVAVTTEV